MDRGTALYIASSLGAVEVTLKNKCFSCVKCKIPLAVPDYLLAGVIYRSSNADICCNQVLNETIREAVSMKSSHILVIGDFNYPEINWNDLSCNDANDHASHDFLNCVQNGFLYQHVTEATHFHGVPLQHGFVPGRSTATQLLAALDQWTDIVDLVFTNEEAMISDLHYCETHWQ
jgi:hypothetical protein